MLLPAEEVLGCPHARRRPEAGAEEMQQAVSAHCSMRARDQLQTATRPAHTDTRAHICCWPRGAKGSGPAGELRPLVNAAASLVTLVYVCSSMRDRCRVPSGSIFISLVGGRHASFQIPDGESNHRSISSVITLSTRRDPGQETQRLKEAENVVDQ